MKIYYHFTKNVLRDGRPIPKIGEWLKHDGPAILCESGLHASPTPFEALAYAPGALLHQVNMRGVIAGTDKVVGTARKIIKTIDDSQLLRTFARKQALSVIPLWDCPSITREYLETGRDDIRYAAWSAARAAARSAAWSAAIAADESAARAAARAAAAEIFNTMVAEAFSCE